MAGYDGWSMSNNAIEAYKNGEKPISKWKKSEILHQIEEMVDNGELSLNCSFMVLEKTPEDMLKKVCLYKSSWHHTGKYYQITNFYSLNIKAIRKLTDERLRKEVSDYREQRKQLRQEKENAAEELWECTYSKWSVSRGRRKVKKITEIGMIKGKWFYTPSGQKKRISAEGFTKNRQIIKPESGESA